MRNTVIARTVLSAVLCAACGAEPTSFEAIDTHLEPSICGGDGWEDSEFQDVEKYSATGGVSKSFIDRRERPVARQAGGCTGTLLGDGLLVTAYHCGTSAGTEFTFNYQVSPTDVLRTTETYTVAEVLEQGDNSDDYTLVRLYNNPENRWGSTGVDPRAPVDDETIVLVQHPGTSRPIATSLKVAEVGTVNSTSGGSITYENLDTDPGSSGAGIIAASSGRLIGVHAWGGCAPGTHGVGNSGTSMERIAQLSEFLLEDHGSGSMFETSAGEALGSSVWDINTWRSTWRHIVSGSFGGTSLADLFFYDGDAGEGQFHTVTTSGITAIGSAHTGMRRDWTQIVPLQVDSSGTNTELLFYDWRTGEGKFYETDGSGSLDLLATATGWRDSWRTIISGDFTDDSGSELLFYDASAGEMKIYEVTSSATLGDAYSNSGFGDDVALVIAGDFHSDAGDEVLVYNPIAGTGKFYSVSNAGQMTLVATHTFRSSWSQIVRANSDGSNLVFYDMSAGEGKFYSISNGAMTLESSTSTWRRSWSKLIAGNFTSASGTELLFYDRFTE